MEQHYEYAEQQQQQQQQPDNNHIPLERSNQPQYQSQLSTNANANATSHRQREAEWDSMYRLLQQFVAENGHFRIPGHLSSMATLLQWLTHQRQCLIDGTVTLRHAQLLYAIGFDQDTVMSKHQQKNRQRRETERLFNMRLLQLESMASSSSTTNSTPAGVVAAGSKRPRPAESTSSTRDEQKLSSSSTSKYQDTTADRGGLRKREKLNHSTGSSSNSSCSNIATAAAVAAPGSEKVSCVKHLCVVEKSEHGNGRNGNINPNISRKRLPDDWCVEPVTRLRRAPNECTVVDPTIPRVEHVEFARIQATTILSEHLAILSREESSFLSSSTTVSKYVVEPFVQSLSLSSQTGFTVQLTQMNTTPTNYWWELVVEGLANVVDLFQAHFKSWLMAKAVARDYELLFQHGICLTVRMDKSVPIGASLTNMRSVRDPRQTVRLSVKRGGQLVKIIGPNATARGGAVLAVNGKPCHSIDAYKQAVQENSETHTFLTFCIDRHADLSRLQESLLALPPWLLDATPLNLDAARMAPLTANNNTSQASMRELVDTAFSRTLFQSSVVQGPNDVARPVFQSHSVKTSKVNKKRQTTAARRRDKDSNSTDNPSASQPESTPIEKVAAYRYFLNRYKDVVSVEYSGSGIVPAMATSQMWRQHKKSQYGPICSDNCNCVFDLPLLTATVVETKVKAELKNPKSKWNEESILRGKKSPTGFTTSFAPKFLPMLMAEFPYESPQQLLHRLLGMWQKHERQMNFGFQCNDTCDCMEGWCRVFRKGQVQEQAPIETAMSHTTNEQILDLGEQSKPALAFSGLSFVDSRQNESSAATNLPRVPKKRKADSGLSSVDTRQNEDSAASNLRRVPKIPKKQKAEALGSLISGLTPPSQATNGESRTDANLLNRVPKKKKMNAAAASSESGLHAIGSGSLLRGLAKPEPEKPKMAKKASLGLADTLVVFGNGEHKRQSSALQASSKILRSSNRPPSTGVENDSRMEPTPPADTWMTVDTKRTIRVDNLLKPILKDTHHGGGNAEKRRVQFGVNPIKECRFYEIDSKTTEFQIKSSEEVSKGTLAPSTDSSKDLSSLYHHDATLQVPDSPTSLSDTIRNKSFKDVLSFFENTKDPGVRSSERLEEALRIVKDSLTSIDAELAFKPKDEALLHQRRDFEFKKSFIKICINATYTLQFARSLKNWVRFEIVVTMIDEIQLSDHAMLEGGENMLSAEVTATYGPNPSEHLPSLPSKLLSSRLEYESPSSYFMKHNVSMEPRTLMIDLSNQNRTSSIELGSVVIPMSDLHKTCSQDGAWCTLTVEASPNFFLLNAKVVIRARRIDLEPQYLEQKRISQCRKVAEVAGWIKRFNANLTAEERAEWQLPRGHFPLLNAAVYLEDDALVKLLLDIDTDKSAKRAASSALSLALNIEDGIAKKTLDEDESPDTEKEWHQDWRRKRLEAIAKLLRDHMHECTFSIEEGLAESSH